MSDEQSLPALFAGISVADYGAAQEWYARLFDGPASFHPNDEEAVWELAESRSVYVRHRPEHAGHALLTLFVDDLGERVAGIAERGLTPHLDETYDNGVRKVTYRDPEGNEIGFGG
jgi:Glyoxalase-like domain